MADVLIRGGTVVNGTGAPGKRADVAVSGGKFVEAGKGSAKRKPSLNLAFMALHS